MFVNSYTRAVKSYDRHLFCEQNDMGINCIFRKEANGKSYVFALTDTWGLNGKSRAWGIDRVVDRLRQIDRTLRDAVEEADQLNEKVDQASERHVKNEVEAFAKDFRRSFAKATDHVLTHSLDKSETKRRIKDRRIK